MKKAQLVEFLKSIGIKEVVVYDGGFIGFTGEDEHKTFYFEMNNNDFSSRGL